MKLELNLATPVDVQPLFKMEESVDSFLPAIQNAPKFSTTVVASTNDVAERNRLPRNFGGDRTAEGSLLVKDPNFRHFAWIMAYRHVFSHVGCKCQRQIAETLEVDAVAANLSRSDLFHQQEVELL
jgi:hypothetical protein